jgi:hypothetical protein
MDPSVGVLIEKKEQALDEIVTALISMQTI